MTISNIFTTAFELLFGIAIIIMFLNQEKLVRFEKKVGIVIRYTKRRMIRRFRRDLRLKRAERNNGINKKFIYKPIPAPCPPDRAA